MFLRHWVWISVAVFLAACNLGETSTGSEESLDIPATVKMQSTAALDANGETDEANEQPTTDNQADEMAVELENRDDPSTMNTQSDQTTVEINDRVAADDEPDQVEVSAVNTSNNATHTQANTATCTLRTDLPTYTVVRGDTLYSIAVAHNSTVAALSAYNCLENNNIIAVGQRLYVPATGVSNTDTSGDDDTDTGNTTTTTIISISTGPPPIINNYKTFDGTTYVVDETEGISITLNTAGLDDRLTRIEFVYTDDRTEYTSISMGIDDDLSDGATLFWTPDTDLQGKIVASGRIPGQMGEGFSSEPIRVESEPRLIGPLGDITVTPNEQAGSTANGSAPHILTAGDRVTITWINMDRAYTDQVTVTHVNFFYYPATGGIVPIGTDNNVNDGISITWVVPDDAFGGISASATVLNANPYISPRVQVQAGNTNVIPCEFIAFDMGSPVPVYGIPNLATDVIRTMAAGETAPVLGTGTDASGSARFYHLDFGASSGWAQDTMGELQGDCDGA